MLTGTPNQCRCSRLENMTDLTSAISALDRFARAADLSRRLGSLERTFTGVSSPRVADVLGDEGIVGDLLEAALVVKRAAGQINVTIHALGILLALPHILEEDEGVTSLSLGAGNTGRAFDLETNKRVAEFKFITWRGGAEAIRQNSIFIDIFNLLQDMSGRRKYLYVLGKDVPLRFLQGGRSIESVLSKNSAIAHRFGERYGEKYKRVNEWYFNEARGLVQIEDLSGVLSAFAQDVLTVIDDTPDSSSAL